MAPKKLTSADEVDTQLARYRSMRDFTVTEEPAGKPAKKPARQPKATRGLPFVIQKHAASHLHYDLRLGWAGVLKSWAVAKGPSYNPKDRRLAVQVEDHPMEYGGFEGIIPAGQYGGGTVMVWDQGTWWPQLGHENVDAGLREGHLKFEMNGLKMKGQWALIRMAPREGEKPGAKPNWLLIKEHDRYERSPDDPAITDQKPNSAVTKRSLDQIARAEDHIWNSNKTSQPQQAWARTPNHSKRQDSKLKTEHSPPATTASPPDLTHLPRETQPAFLPPQLAVEASTPPLGDYLHELKLDGYRLQARKSGTHVQLLTRSGLDWTHRIPSIAAAIAQLPAKSLTLDGELVVLGPDGVSNFAHLQASFQNHETHPLTYFAFDLLHLNGHNPRNLPLTARKSLLAGLLSNSGPIRLSEHLTGPAATIFHHACQLHAEGIISKRADAPYHPGRSATWLKSKCLHEQEFVIAGWSDSTQGPNRIGSLLLAYYDTLANWPTEKLAPENPNRPAHTAKPQPRSSKPVAHSSKTNPATASLVYAGRTGTGFTQKLKHDLHKQLSALETRTSPLATVPADARRNVHWVRPTLVAQVRFATWTADNLVRQAAFLGLREDKPATEVIRELPSTAPTPKHSPSSKPAPTQASPKPRSSLKSSTLSPVQNPSATHTTRPAHATKTLIPHPQTLTPTLTHPDKLLDPTSNLTKQQLAEFYIAIAPYILPHIADRPLSLVRCPDGTTSECFFQKHVNKMTPKILGSVAVPDKKYPGKSEPYITLNTPEQLAALAQIGVLEIHPWGSRNDDLEHPDRLILDLDPDPSLPFSTVAAAAAEVRKRLKICDLASFLKLTGGKGLHIVAPIEPTLTWDELKTAAHQFVDSMARDQPALYLTKMTKAARTGRIYLDYLRNERGATAVAPFSPRARPGMNVSLPLPWSALKEKTLPAFPVADFATWRSRLRSDPWRALASTRQRLDVSKFHAL
jgi:bifunctional non-homologous end joining protein LigD